MCFTKVSLLLTYLAIFPNKVFRRCDYAVMAFVISYGFASIIATILQCEHATGYWDVPPAERKCFNTRIFWWFNAAANLTGDLMTLLLPLPALWRLNMPTRTRIALMFVFLLGVL